jgi:NAD(P)-dependent dehydrogenase (short-subunit alcohol dehydrogenase family)
MTLTGQTALITGGGRGIGAAIARRLAAAGASVIVLGRSEAPLQQVASETGGRYCVCDVTDPSAYAAAVEQAGPVDLLVNNAGTAETAAFLKSDAALWQRTFDINLMATVTGCRLVLPGMLERGRGRIVNIASTAGVKAYAYVSAYVAAKHAVVGLTRALALEVVRSGITVNAVCPGYTDTDLVSRAVETIVGRTGRTAGEARAAFLNPQGRLIAPEEVAETVLWLAGPGAASVTGQAIILSGGEI